MQSRKKSAIRRHPHIRPMFAGLRHYDRKDARFGVSIRDTHGLEVPFDGVNVSESGLFVTSMFLYEIGEVHDLVLRSGQGQELIIKGKVVRVEGGRGCPQPGMAYEFVQTDRDTFHGLSDFVATL